MTAVRAEAYLPSTLQRGGGAQRSRWAFFSGLMKFGYYIINTYVPELDGPDAELYAHWLEQIDAAEDLGFDSLWVTEHHFRLFGGMLPNPQLLLTAAAQRTRRLRLGTSVTLLPMHNPIRIAE
ncbi:MAG TPA: LLM class flavin-dependent oxidoreductase, partial [Candidatus Binatia bacterium]|nr:LLM class flavin-dependent oxidoreductase [Candidatus Binatia bacterium]